MVAGQGQEEQATAGPRETPGPTEARNPGQGNPQVQEHPVATAAGRHGKP